MQFKDLPKFTDKPFNNNEAFFMYSINVNNDTWKDTIIDWVSRNQKQPIKAKEKELFHYIFSKEIIQGGMVELDYRDIHEKLDISLTTTFKLIGKLCEKKIIAKSIDSKLYWINPAIFTPVTEQRVLAIKIKMIK